LFACLSFLVVFLCPEESPQISGSFIHCRFEPFMANCKASADHALTA
jgi:hypothetical protein